jgi:site-specific DNA-cytosine methylase
MRILEELRVKNPNVLFLLENVEMGAKWEKILSNAIGVRGIHINSALVSAQNRKRIYWINWGMKPSGLFGDMESIIEQPKDRGILLKDILESQVEEKYFLSEKMINGFERHKERHNEKGTGFGYIPKTEIDKGNSLRANAALCPTDNTIIVQNAHNISNQGKNINEKLLKSHSLMARDYKGFGNQGMTRIVVHNTQRRDPNRPSIQKNKNAGGSGHLSRNDGKTYCLDGCNTNAVEIVALTEIRTEQAKQIRRQTGTNPKRQKELVERTDGKIGALLTNQTPDNLVKITNAVEIFNNKRLNETIENNNLVDNCLIDSYNQSIHTDKSITISTRVNASSCTHIYKNSRIRRLTPKECMRLQTVDDNYLMPVSDSQKYKVLGNGWTIEVISYLFKHI